MMTPAKTPVVLSVEQALSMSYATLRFVHLGWRVIRVEATPSGGRRTAGDPNRYIGREVAGADRHGYFVAPNVGKEAIALNLKEARGRELLHSRSPARPRNEPKRGASTEPRECRPTTTYSRLPK